MKVALVANCQAWPVADLIKMQAPNVEITGTIITHLSKMHDETKAMKVFEAADFIFAQAVQDSFAIPFVRTKSLKDRFGNKVITWPNAVFKGQAPDICYVTCPTKGRISGPLGGYQNVAIFEAWRDGLGVAQTVQLLRDGGEWLEKLVDVPDASLRELRKRESYLDVVISDSISMSWQTVRLFYTFNHPNKHILHRIACALLEKIGAQSNSNSSIERYSEPLDRILPALLPSMADRLGLMLETGTVSKGYHVTHDCKIDFAGSPCFYELNSLIETSFRCLEHQIRPDSTVRIS